MDRGGENKARVRAWGAGCGSEPGRGDRLPGGEGEDSRAGGAADDARVGDGGAIVVEEADTDASGRRDLLFA